MKFDVLYFETFGYVHDKFLQSIMQPTAMKTMFR